MVSCQHAHFTDSHRKCNGRSFQEFILSLDKRHPDHWLQDREQQSRTGRWNGYYRARQGRFVADGMLGLSFRWQIAGNRFKLF